MAASLSRSHSLRESSRSRINNTASWRVGLLDTRRSTDFPHVFAVQRSWACDRSRRTTRTVAGTEKMRPLGSKPNEPPAGCEVPLFVPVLDPARLRMPQGEGFHEPFVVLARYLTAIRNDRLAGDKFRVVR